MPRPSSTLLLALLGTVASTLACVIPDEPLSNNITEKFQIFVQNPAFPIVHDSIMNFRPNGLDMHLVLRPAGQDTYDTIWLENGFLRNDDRYAVIDLEYNANDNTTKMFMTDRKYATALFQPVYGCDPDTDELQIRLVLVSRLADPDEGQAREDGGQIGIQEAGYTGVYEFRYSPANNSLLVDTWFTVNMVIFRDGVTPPATSTTTSASSPTSTASISDYDFVSCWAEPDDGSRTLTTVYSMTSMTNEICAVDCAGSEYFGTQYSVECWCGSSLGSGSYAAPSTDCSNACSGDATEICGGGRRLSLYQLKSSNSSATMTTSVASSSSSTTSSLSSTTSSSPPTTSSLISSTTSSSSSVTTSSQSLTSTSISTSTSITSTTLLTSTLTTSTTASTTSTNPTGLPSVGVYSFVSCWAEPDDGRALSAAFKGTDDMTLETCAAFCSTYPYFGTEWSSECWCGDKLTSGSNAAPLLDCDYTCAGDATEMCGGSRRLSLYQNVNWRAPEDPSSIGSYEFYGCVTDSPARTLTASSLTSSAMTLELCATFCSSYKYFGVEWSVECYCGNDFTAGAALVDSSECSMTCGGNSEELCGAGDRLSVYQLAAV
ncbi:WSC domain-containing protein [Halenospora varia]|nr:WSC domain-containing protein [Halenospora varia]